MTEAEIVVDVYNRMRRSILNGTGIGTIGDILAHKQMRQGGQVNFVATTNMKERFPKGKTVKHRVYGWPGIVTIAPRGKNSMTIECVEVFGIAHEMGSVYCRDYEPCSIKEFHASLDPMWKNEKRYFKGELK